MNNAYIFLFLFTLITSCQKKSTPVPPTLQNTIFYCSNRTGNYEIYSIKNSVETQISIGSNFDSWWPRIAPNKKSMIFYRSPAKNKNNNYKEAELWSMDLDGKNLKLLIKLSDNNWLEQGVANWSPDGAKLVMTAQKKDTQRWHIFISNANGTNPLQVSKREGFYLDPSFSPDGTKIVCSAFPEGYLGTDFSKLEIFTMNLDGTNETQITHDNIRDHDPSWSPDGKEIAFESAVDPTYLGVGKWAIRSVKPNGTDLKNIIDDGNINTLPNWSADSKILYFHRLVFGKSPFRIYKINIDGTNLESITTGTDNYDDSDAQPLN